MESVGLVRVVRIGIAVPVGALGLAAAVSGATVSFATVLWFATTVRRLGWSAWPRRAESAVVQMGRRVPAATQAESVVASGLPAAPFLAAGTTAPVRAARSAGAAAPFRAPRPSGSTRSPGFAGSFRSA